MATTKHSKGPWRIDNWDEVDESGREYVDILDAQGVNICTVADCDAPIIAAAPLMLEALKAVLEVHDEPCRLDHHGLCQTHHLRSNDAGEPECEVELVRAAIAAASGAAKEEGRGE